MTSATRQEGRAGLPPSEAALVKIFAAGCTRQWAKLPPLAREFYSSGGTGQELQMATRFLITVAGYGPTLKATFTLHKAGLLPEDPLPGKAGGDPGNAFELVYTSVTDVVRSKMQAADPVLAEWIRTHLYGDVYSSPGLDLRMKQVLICSGLVAADMPDQLFGHALAGMRFGATVDQLRHAAELALQLAGSVPPEVEQEAFKILTLADRKFRKDYLDNPADDQVRNPAGSVRVPPLPPLYNTPAQPAPEERVGPAPPAAGAPPPPAGEQRFAWEELEAKRKQDIA